MSELIDFNGSPVVTNVFYADFEYFKNIKAGTIEEWNNEFEEYKGKLAEIGGTPTLAYENSRNKNLVIHIAFNPPRVPEDDDYRFGAKASELATKATLLKIVPDMEMDYFMHLRYRHI